MRIGIVGCGYIAEHQHLPAYKNIEELEIIALCDVNEQRAKALSEKFGVPRTYTEYEKMFEKEDLDIVTVASIPQFHGPIAMAAANRGINVFCEKPLAMSLDEANKVVQTAELNKVKLMVNQNFRWRPEFEAAKKIVDAKLLGEIFYANIEQFFWNDHFQGSYTMPNIIHEMVVHYIDLLRWLVGREAEKVYALGTNIVKQVRIAEYPLAMIMIDFGNDVIGRTDVSWISKGSRVLERGRVEGTQGCILINWDRPVAVFTEKFAETMSFFQSNFVKHGWYYPEINYKSVMSAFERNMRLFIECLKTNTEPPTSGRDNLNTLRIVFAAIESLKTKKVVEIVH